jgi:hypothetical protein
MPAVGTDLYNWKNTQSGSGSRGLDHLIEKEIESNEGSTVWRDRKVRLIDCIALKNGAMRSNKWEENYSDFEAHDGMPAVGTKLYNGKRISWAVDLQVRFIRLRRRLNPMKGTPCEK